MNKKLLTLLLSLLFISCTPPEEPSDTDGTNDNDTSVTDIDPNDQINFPDPVLRACVEELTGKGAGDPIYAKEVADITEVNCNNVSDLTGMEFFIKTEYFAFYNNSINSLNPLSSLPNIKYLFLRGGGVANLNDISGLTNLVDFEYLQSNLEDISILVNMEKLERVWIKETKIKNISALSSLPNLKELHVSDNPTLTTLGAQFTAPKLTNLNVSNCGLTSLNELSGLPELTSLLAGDNYISDVSFIPTLPKLETLQLSGNCIEDVSEWMAWYNKIFGTDYSPSKPDDVAEFTNGQDYAKCQ